MASSPPSAALGLDPRAAGWHFVTLPPDVANEIRARSAETARAFGSVPVRDARSHVVDHLAVRGPKSSSYLLPIKAAARRRERIEAGDAVTATIELR